jgi:predicted Zn-dependent protease
MKIIIISLTLLTLSSPAFAQLGGLGGALKKAQQVQDQKKKLDELTISEDEERRIGDEVSEKVRARFGVVQDAAIHKYVTLVGTALAQQSERPRLDWRFVVLDTDGVNAFAAPGGIVHITRGALGLVRNESELAAVLGHEIGHVAHKHTVNAIRKSKAVQFGTSQGLADRAPVLKELANRAYEMVLENSFDRGDELDADTVSVALTQKLGYASGALADFLARLDERNRDQPERNGLFASHPETKERIAKVRAAGRPGAAVDARYRTHVKYEPTPITSIAVVADGASGLTGSTKPSGSKDADAAKEEPKKKGFGLANLTKSAGSERQSAQVSASGGARGLGPDRAAKGGGNPALVRVSVTAAEVDAFRKGIA